MFYEHKEVGSDEGLDTEKTYRAPGYSGVAFRIDGWAVEWKPQTFLTDEGWEVEELFEGEWVDTPPYVVCHMVGDDRLFKFELDDLTPLADEEFCPECGQVGCTALKSE